MTEKDKAGLLMSEHESLYSLYQLRLNAVEKRLPIAFLIITALLSSTTVLPDDIKTLYLLGIPVALIYLVRTTKTHIQSFEDLLRRVEEIEQRVNQLAGEELLNFQSKHPSRNITVGGRFGRESAHSVLILSILVLSACFYLFHKLQFHHYLTVLYGVGVFLIAIYLLVEVQQLKRYRYRKS